MKKINNTHDAILHLICGLPGSGKTTLAQQIVKSHDAVRMCPDVWIKDIWRDSAEGEGNKYRYKIEQLQWKIAREFLRAGKDVVIEWGTWGRHERTRVREEARGAGAKVKFYYLDFPKEILKKRIIERNKNLGNDDFVIPEDTLDKVLDESFRSLDVPDKDELDSYDFLG